MSAQPVGVYDFDAEVDNFEQAFLDRLAEKFGQPVEGFKVDTIEKADWVLTKLQASVSRIKDQQQIRDNKKTILKALYEQKLAEIEDNYNLAIRADENDARGIWERFGVDVQAIVAERIKDTKRKSETVAGVQIGTRKVPATVKVLDQEKTVAWASINLVEALVVIEKVDSKIIKEHYKEKKVVPDGCLLKQEQEVPVLKTSKVDVLKLLGLGAQDDSGDDEEAAEPAE